MTTPTIRPVKLVVLDLIRRYRIALALMLLCLLLQLLDLERTLRFDRELISDGAWWRALTANFIHLGWNHFWLNMSGAALVFALFVDTVREGEWLAVIVIASLGIAVAVLALNPEIHWYVGLSGTLHGMFTYGAVTELRHARGFAVALLTGAALKLGWEQLVGSLPGTAEAVGGEVVVDAHLYGALAGIVLAVVWWFGKARGSAAPARSPD